MAGEPRFAWDADKGRFRYAASGRLVPERLVRDALDTALQNQSERAAGLTRSLQERAISVAEWEAGMRALVQESHLYSATAARGGFAQMTEAGYSAVGERVAQEYAYLDRFRTGIEDGTRPLDGRAVSDATLYAESARGTYHEAVRTTREETAAANGTVLLAFNALHPADHCEECEDLAALGWIDPDQMPEPGDRECGPRCKCTVEYMEVPREDFEAAAEGPFAAEPAGFEPPTDLRQEFIAQPPVDELPPEVVVQPPAPPTPLEVVEVPPDAPALTDEARAIEGRVLEGPKALKELRSMDLPEGFEREGSLSFPATETAKAQREALATYQGGDYKGMNALYRLEGEELAAFREAEHLANLRTHADALETLFEAAPALSENLRVYRTISDLETRFGFSDPRQAVGLVVEDKAFVSVTISETQATRWGNRISGGSDFGVFEVVVPKGTKAVFPEAVAPQSNYVVQQEVILSPGSGRWRITEVTVPDERKPWMYRIKAEMLP